MREMGRVDRLNEEIGWLKVVFGLLAAVEISLIGWLAQNYLIASVMMVAIGCVAVVVVTASLFGVDWLAYQHIEAPENS